jgi:DNA-binding Lrp family transcriptional regulator
MLDDVDRGLVHALHIDGRAPFSRIAEVLGVSTQTVARRYRRLRGEVGLRVVGLADLYRAGQTQWTVRLTTTPAASRAVAHSLARRPDTSWVKLTSGGTEIFALIHAPYGMQPSQSLLLHDIPRRGAITAVSAHCLLHSYLGGPTTWRGRLRALSPEQQRQLEPVLGPAGEPQAPSEDPSHIDEPPHLTPNAKPRASSHDLMPYEQAHASTEDLTGADQALIDALRHDGRATYAELAAATGWSQATVSRRLTDLRARRLLFFDVEIDTAAYGITSQTLLWMAVEPAHLDRVGTALAAHDELAVVMATTGPTNLLAQALCPTPAALHHYLTRRISALDGIRSLESAPVLQTLKAAGHLTPAMKT